jgi:predicted membrane-bound spermidine synthase
MRETLAVLGSLALGLVFPKLLAILGLKRGWLRVAVIMSAVILSVSLMMFCIDKGNRFWGICFMAGAFGIAVSTTTEKH